VFRRIGQLIPEFRAIAGAEKRAERLMTEGRKQPDDGIYELLVAGIYKKRGWTNVEFVPEIPASRGGPICSSIADARTGRSNASAPADPVMPRASAAPASGWLRGCMKRRESQSAQSS
jgi:hypothetical protein